MRITPPSWKWRTWRLIKFGDVPIAIYVVIDGKFMAKRANCRWVSILPGFVLQPPPTLVLQ